MKGGGTDISMIKHPTKDVEKISVIENIPRLIVQSLTPKRALDL